MRNYWVLIVGLILGLGLGMGWVIADDQEEPIGLKAGTKAPMFDLKDANDEVYQLEKLRGKAVLLIMGNRKLRDEDNKWAKRIRKLYPEEDRLVVFIVADMRSVPRFIPKALIRSQLRRSKPPATLLLDWDGKTHQAYHTKLDKPNLVLIDSLGRVAHFTRAKHSEENEKLLREQIDAALPKG